MLVVLIFSRTSEQPTFIPKPHLVLSLYYPGKVEQENETLIAQAIQKMYEQKKASWSIVPVPLSNESAFFGRNQNELIVKISDPTALLTTMNTDIKNALHEAHDDYYKQHGKELFSKEYADFFPFVPHITLGKIVWRKFEQDSAATTQLRQQILQAITSLVEELSSEAKKIMPDNFCIYDGVQKRTIKSWKL